MDALDAGVACRQRHDAAFHEADRSSCVLLMYLDAPQAVVQLGEVVTSLGDRVWATWFASGSATASQPQNVSILGTARVPLQVRL